VERDVRRGASLSVIARLVQKYAGLCKRGHCRRSAGPRKHRARDGGRVHTHLRLAACDRKDPGRIIHGPSQAGGSPSTAGGADRLVRNDASVPFFHFKL